MPGGGAWGGGGGVFEARIKQIVSALKLVLRPGIPIPGRKSSNFDARGGGSGVFEARIEQIAALK